MKFYYQMPDKLLHFYREELTKAKQYQSSDNAKSWRHLERAHILGQPYPIQHTYVHWQMLKFGFRIKSAKEILGQLPRLAVGGVKSFVGVIPTGNTGGANVAALQPMPIPADLQIIIATNSYE